MKTKRGYTLVEVMIGVAVVGVFAAILVVPIGRRIIDDNASALSQSRAWAHDMGLEVQGVSCAAYDTDGNGYVSCSLASKRPDGTTEIIPIECASRFSMNSGCRAARVLPVR